MCKNMSGVATCVGIGLAATGAGIALSKCMCGSNTKRMFKKKANKAMKTMETLIDDIQYMFK